MGKATGNAGALQRTKQILAEVSCKSSGNASAVNATSTSLGQPLSVACAWTLTLWAGLGALSI